MELNEAKQILNETGYYLVESKRYTRAKFKKMAKENKATDITNLSFDAVKELKATKGLTKIGVSFGNYGMNGGLFEDNEGNLYVVLARNSVLMFLA